VSITEQFKNAIGDALAELLPSLCRVIGRGKPAVRLALVFVGPATPPLSSRSGSYLRNWLAKGLSAPEGLTGIGHPDTIIKLLGEGPAPAAVQCIANLLDSPGGLRFFDGPAKPREIMAAARANRVGVMGIRAVQAGALTAAIDRPLPVGHPEVRDYQHAAGFRRLAAELGDDPAVLAHRYALALDIDTLVLGVKNRRELADCIAAAEAGPLPLELINRIDQAINHPPGSCR
jgi:aryl-alcohol dehydrogenase-like predicted oxidoreductase